MIVFRKIDEADRVIKYKRIRELIEVEKKDKDTFKESQLQNMIIAYLNEKNIDYHPSMSGIKAGHSDLIIYAKTKKHEVLLLELKTVKGRLSDVQKKWLRNKAKQGYAVSVAHGYYDAIYKIEKYLEDKPILYGIKNIKKHTRKINYFRLPNARRFRRTA